MPQSLPDILDRTAFAGMAIANCGTGFNVSIETTPGHWSPFEFATSASAAILKCIEKHALAVPAAAISPPPY